MNDVAFLDTPGHAAFASMRDSSKADTDMLMLVIDCKEDAQEQSNEIMQQRLCNVENALVANDFD